MPGPADVLPRRPDRLTLTAVSLAPLHDEGGKA